MRGGPVILSERIRDEWFDIPLSQRVEFVCRLTEREKHILSYRWESGRWGVRRLGYARLGQAMGISGSRIRELEWKLSIKLTKFIERELKNG
jgi:DNA-directed RNA polymerase sigma subunit (sigma70/sigma32)